ncbi:exodeoxyribonuclease V subunit gamma [Caldimonas tepidiphila]|uniref:exodeoxyribonuclease V subunit gamma n=1 Tax=Caldimonas tepidiphila TaxID=2315841 RepID=UPI000E5B7501|nr:exodeoxyribonuclease V subunit gamma [Caldimonas tepidiphila]
MTTTEITPGLLVLHGNRLELLKAAVFDWLARQPLGPLEPEVILVQSNGVAEWLKMAMAASHGVCAAARVELPARFLWRSYRQVLGRESVPPLSPLDETPLTWRLMRLLPQLLERPEFAPLARFLAGGDLGRRLQLAQRLADLYDQYQVHRADWLGAWAAGQDLLARGNGEAAECPEDQRWQPLLWRELLAELDEAQRLAVRPGIHQRFLAALESGAPPAEPVARRVVVFGMSQLPMQMLEGLHALSRHAQVLLAVPNPCQFHWGDIIEGRELLRAQRRRQQQRGERDLAAVSLEEMHAHANPLLAAWGRQGRDFVRQLDAFDDAQAARQRFGLTRIDLFDTEPGGTLLAQVQGAIRDLMPLAEHPRTAPDAAERSIVFHVAHSAQREVEVLHDQLLALLADPPDREALGPLKPRDIVVMVPDIDTFAPAIRAVFGQYGRSDPRHIPFDIADLQQRGNQPLLVALEWLLRLPQQRCRLAEIRDLLDVPAVAARFGVHEDELPRLSQWMAGAGVRWGLHREHRADLGLAACGEQNTWAFGLRRMLLGYASGAGASWQGIEAYGEVGGLEAAVAGSLVALVEALMRWRALAVQPATPAEWAARARALLEDFFAPTDERERLSLGAVRSALEGWLRACEDGGFDEAVPLAVLREAWLAGIDEPSLRRRFLDGGVTFCTLMPMRAIPFEVVCLLGMNDGDYPRRTTRADFDLMGLPGQRRPGDRSRRDDDRYLMLEALLSARRQFYVSWAGRSVRDNSEQPPSVLVSQLRDYLAAGWCTELPQRQTTEHPLQPFSRRYFEHGGLTTWAREWRAAHQTGEAAAAAEAGELPRFEPDPRVPLTLARLADFLRNPVRHHFRMRLDVVFDDADAPHEDDEPFGLSGLDAYDLMRELLDDAERCPGESLHEEIARRARRIERCGRLPMGGLGVREREALVAQALPAVRQWQQVQRDFAEPAPKERLAFEHGGLRLEDWLDGLRLGEDGPVWLELSPGVLCGKDKAARADKLLHAWVRQLAASACGVPLRGRLVSRDAVLGLAPLPQARAAELLRALLDAWRAGMDAPLPLACRTALAFVRDEARALPAYEGGHELAGECEEPCLARVYPDHDALVADGRFATLARELYGPLDAWVAEGGVDVTLHADLAAAGEDIDG